MSEHFDCPTCSIPMPEQYDYECATCGLMASEHISVTSMCKVLRAVSNREASLIVERDKLKRELDEAREQRDGLAEAAQAVVDRWETPFWKEVGQYHYIDSLRKALAAVEGGRP